MRRAIFYLIGAAVVAGLAFVLLHRPAPKPASAPVAAAELTPKTAMPVRRAFALELPWTGQVQSWTRLEVEALADGRVASVAVADEAPVEKGATLFTIGGARVTAQKQQLQDQVDSLEGRVKLAQEVVERQNQSAQERLATLNQIAAARDALAKLTAELGVARQHLQTFQDALKLKAPAAGVFTGRRVSAGQAVNAGQTLAEILDPAHLRIEAHVFAPAGVALEGLDATVRLSQTRTLSGKVTHVLPAADAEGATVVWIEGEQIDAGLRAGEVAGGTLAARTHEAWGVPESAIVYDEHEAPYVFVARGGGFEKAAVKVGVSADGWVEVLSGLDGTLPVVTSGAYELYYRQFSQSYKVPD